MYLLKILEFLILYSDRDRHVTVRDISEYLLGCGIEPQKKTIRANISKLIDFFKDNKFFSIAENEAKNGRREYWVENRVLDSEDAVNIISSLCENNSLSLKYKYNLGRKICRIIGEQGKTELYKKLSFENFKISDFKRIYSVFEIISEAIEKNKMVKFKYTHNPAYINPEIYITVSPCKILQKNTCLYLLAGCKDYDLSVFRLDKINSPEITDTEADKVCINTDSSPLFSGKEMLVTMIAEKSIMGCIYDRYGYDVNQCTEIDGRIRIIVKDKSSHEFMGWLFMLGNNIEILHPELLKAEYKNRLKARLTY